MATYGCASWERNPRRAFRDALRLTAAGFAWVDLPVSEERMAFDFDGVRSIIATLRLTGLEVRVSPWGVARLFGGEGLSAARTPHAQVTLAEQWLRQAEALEPDAIYWDEPQGTQGSNALFNLAFKTDLPQHLYWNPGVGVRPPDDVFDRMESIGIDCYDGDLPRAMDEREWLASQYGKPVHVWVRAFGLDRAHACLPSFQIRRLQQLGVDDIAVWGYPSPGVSILNNERPRKTWRAIAETVRELA